MANVKSDNEIDRVNESKTSIDTEVIYILRDRNPALEKSWKKVFGNYIDGRIQVSCGDIFRSAPAADALVSPANSFGFMDGGIDQVYINCFGWQLQKRLQAVIREEYSGELLVGQAHIIPMFDCDTPKEKTWFEGYNENRPIKYLISAPTMRVPQHVDKTVNSYLAFRAVILAVKKHNAKIEDESERISTVLCPGLGTSVGRMPPYRCAAQMLHAFETYEIGIHSDHISPPDLNIVWNHDTIMAQASEASDNQEDYQVYKGTYTKCNIL